MAELEPVDLPAEDEPKVRKRVPKKRASSETTKAKEVSKPTPAKDDGPEPVTLDADSASGKFTPLDGAKALMDVMAAVHHAKGNECCEAMYKRQKLPVAVAINELAKDSPILQSWITHGKAFKAIALIVAVEPLVEHSWRDHLRPSVQARRNAQEIARLEQQGYWLDDDGNWNEPDTDFDVNSSATDELFGPTEPQPFRGRDERMTPEAVRKDYGPTPEGDVVAGNGAVVPAPARG